MEEVCFLLLILKVLFQISEYFFLQAFPHVNRMKISGNSRQKKKKEKIFDKNQILEESRKWKRN